MQTKKDAVREQIIEAAVREFSAKGFEKSSLRNVASLAGVSKGNIYVYFPSKDELFRALVEPAYEYLKSTMRSHREEGRLGMMRSKDGEAMEASGREFLDYVRNLAPYREGLKLLFLHSAGSSFGDFREEIFSLYTKSAFETCRLCSEYRGEVEEPFPEMFLHSMASLYLRFIEEILVHEPESAELEGYVRLMASMVHYGYFLFLKGGKG